MGISTHILDTSLGSPAEDVPTSLSRMTDGGWRPINSTSTDADGRCKHLLPQDQALQRGTYRIHFETARYYKEQGLRGLYPYVDIVFEVQDEDHHYHIPLLLTANGYTTYRGS
jgi:5-hydroxyisourate hydrolase